LKKNLESGEKVAGLKKTKEGKKKRKGRNTKRGEGGKKGNGGRDAKKPSVEAVINRKGDRG